MFYKILILLSFIFLWVVENHVVAQSTQIATLSWGKADGSWCPLGDPSCGIEQFPNDLVILGDPGYLYLRLKLENDPVNNLPIQRPLIRVELPKGIDFSQVNVTQGTRADNILISEAGLTPVASFTAATAPTGNAATLNPGPRTITFEYIANSRTLRLGDSLVLKIRIRAIWESDVLNPGMIKVTVSSGDNQNILGTTEKNYLVNVIRPELRIRPTPGFDETIIFANILDTMLVSVDLDAQQGHTRSAYIMYAYNSNFVYLDSFKFDGKDLPLLPSNSGSGVFHNTRLPGTMLPGPSATQNT